MGMRQAVAEGSCGACHDPHESDGKKLLKKSGRELCLSCHDGSVAVNSYGLYGWQPDSGRAQMRSSCPRASQ